MITGHIMGEGDTASLMAGDILFCGLHPFRLAIWQALSSIGRRFGLHDAEN